MTKKKKLCLRLCLLCKKYYKLEDWKKHLAKCEKKFCKEKGIKL